MNTIIYNNDIGTSFIVLFCMISVTCIIVILFENFNSKHLILFSSYGLIICLLVISPDSFRWFQTEYIYGKVIVKKIFSHDTRTMNTYFTYDKEGMRLENYASGSVLFYLSTDKELYTIRKSIYPELMHFAKKGKELSIVAWKQQGSVSNYEICEIKSV
jgi:hypothetical protein